MKLASLLFAGTLSIALTAIAQESVVCVRAQDGSCVWVNQSQPQSQSQSPQAYPIVQFPSSPTVDDPPPPPSPAETEVWFDWAAASLEPDPMVGKPGGCARTAGYARYRFALGMQSNDINKIIEAYDWRGRSSLEADALVARLEAIPRVGGWERSVITGWVGEDPGKMTNDHWRWSADGQVFHFSMREVDECWFVSFASDPGNSAVLQRQEREDQAPLPEPAEKEPGVYEF